MHGSEPVATCSVCGRPAQFGTSNKPLCLDCANKQPKSQPAAPNGVITLTVQVSVQKAELMSLLAAVVPERAPITVELHGNPEPGWEERIRSRLSELVAKPEGANLGRKDPQDRQAHARGAAAERE